MPIEAYAIPIEDKFILYRPLLRLAFVGNRAMADLVLRLAEHESPADVDGPQEVIAFLEQIGFLRPDPPPPPLPDPAFQPVTAVLLMTNRCNLRCTYCYANAGVLAPEDLTLELAQMAIDGACQNAIERGQQHFEICFHGGGEPTQHWQVMKDATAYARTKDLPARVSMVSNGVWSSKQREWILNSLDSVTISLDGNQSTQDSQRPLASGEGSFKYVMQTIEALDAAKFQYGVRMTATAPWCEKFPADVRFICEETGCRSIQVEPAFNTARGEHQEAEQEQGEAFIEAFMEAFEIASRAGRSLIYSGARPWLLTRTFCSAPYDALIVNADGNLVTCYEIASDDHVMAKMSTIGRVVDAQVEMDYMARDSILGLLAEKKNTQCTDCFCRWHCAGDCYTRSFVVDNGTIRSSQARCTINQQITARLLLYYIMAGDGIWQGQRVVAGREMWVERSRSTSAETCEP